MYSVVFFLGLKIDEMTEEHRHTVLCVLPCNCHFIPTELVCCQAKGYYSSSVCANYCVMDVMKKVGENHWNRSICLFLCSINTRGIIRLQPLAAHRTTGELLEAVLYILSVYYNDFFWVSWRSALFLLAVKEFNKAS
jgi:hypothetical protein